MFIRVLSTLVVASLTLPATAHAWPDRPVKVVVPFPAGGPLDITARLLGERMAEKYKQPFIIENRPGAAGNLGTEAVARAEPDGHTLLMVLDTPLTVNPSLYGNLQFNPEKDLVPIAIVASFSQMLVAHPSVGANSLAEFAAYAKSVPLTYGSGGASGNPGHLTMEYFRARSGFEASHVSYRGNPQVVADLVGGHIKTGFVAIPGCRRSRQPGEAQGPRSLRRQALTQGSERPDGRGNGLPRLRHQLLSRVAQRRPGSPTPYAPILNAMCSKPSRLQSFGQSWMHRTCRRSAAPAPRRRRDSRPCPRNGKY